jgi:hypothetical protein
MEAVLLGALVIVLLVIIFRIDEKRNGSVREPGRGVLLREQNQDPEAEQHSSGVATTRKLPVEKLAVAVAGMAMIALVDAQTGQISLWPLYLGPVIFVSWVSGFAAGAFAAGLAGALLVIAAVFSGHPYANNYFFALATISQVVALVVVAWLADRAAPGNGKRHLLSGGNGSNRLAH